MSNGRRTRQGNRRVKRHRPHALAGSVTHPWRTLIRPSARWYSSSALAKPEKELIRDIRQLARRSGPVSRALIRGIGDDCAVLRIPAGHEALLTTDFSLEGVHFRREWHPADSVGQRCLARGLSDVAAMGGTPMAAFVSLALPAQLPPRWTDGFWRGFLRLAKRFSVPLAGGDLAQSPAGVLADVVVLGSVPHGRAVLRSGAKPGDLLYVSGSLGGSAASLRQLQAGSKLRPRAHTRHFFPEPRVAVGKYLSQRCLATAMIDISDGLSTDLAHICEESRVAAVLWREAIPTAADLNLALHGGDDYELLFSAKPGSKIPRMIAGVRVTSVGEIIAGNGEMWIQDIDRLWGRLQPAGWEHFAGK